MGIVTELHNMSIYCYEATDGWSKRRFALITADKSKAEKFMEDLCRRFSYDSSEWTYSSSNIMDSFYLSCRVVL